MTWLKKLFGAQAGVPSVRRVTIRNPFVIKSPRIGLFNLSGSSAENILHEDVTTLSPMFHSSEERTDAPPNCDVLLLYARFESDGSIANYQAGLRDIIRDSRAAIAIVASENDGKSYIAASRKTGYGQANLVFTLKRKGAAFVCFYKELFGKMFAGTTMPMAWVQLAPQNPQAKGEDCPDCLFVAEISHIVFK